MHSAAKSRPQPPPESHDYPQQHHPHSSFATTCLWCFFVIALLSLVMFGLISLVAVMTPKTKNPQVDLQEVGVQYINVANASLSLAIRMLFTAKNDNDVDIEYGVSTFNITYRGIPLGLGSVPRFKQRAHSVRKVETSMKGEGVNLAPGDAAELARDASVDDRVEFRIMGDVNANIPDSIRDNFSTIFVQVSIDCVIAISPRKQALTYKRCGFV